MKKALKIILGVLAIIVAVATVLYYTVPTVQTVLQPYFLFLIAAFIILVALWIVIAGVSAFKHEAGKTVDGKIKFHEDKERRPNIDEQDTQDVYSNFERAEFTTKVKESYQKEVFSFPETFERPEPIVEEEQVVEETPVVEEVKEEPVVEEVVVVEPVVEETPVVEESAPEPEPVKEEPVVEEKPKKKVKLVGIAKKKTKPFQLWEGLKISVSDGWLPILTKELEKESIKANVEKIHQIYDSGKAVYPPKENILKPFEFTDFANVRVVIIGKIPYYRKNQADGLAFSTAKAQDINQSTTVIINEAVSDVGIKQPTTGSLENWARNGVLLLNSVLTAPTDKPANHTANWSELTNDVIDMIIKDKSPKVFLLWGEHARQFAPAVQEQGCHLVIEAPNPSPLSAANGFYGSKPFSKANEFLVEKGFEPIDWELE